MLPTLAKEEYRLSVVLPVYSETDSVRQVVTWLRDRIGPRLQEIIIILSPKSSPESQAVCQALTEEDERVRLFVQQNNPGLGNAVREGMARARGNLILSMDSDGEMEIETVPRMIEQMERTGCDMVVASRWAKGGGFSGYSPFKKVLNWGFQQLFRVLFRTRIHDLTYGFKLLRAELVHNIEWQGVLHEIACETTLKPLRMGAHVEEVPTRWTARVQGVTKNAFMRNFRYVGMAGKILMDRELPRSAGAPLELPLQEMQSPTREAR